MPILAGKVKTKKVIKALDKFVEQKKKTEYITKGQLIEQAVEELLEREGWDIENERFIDYDEDENEKSDIPSDTHTFLGEPSVEEIRSNSIKNSNNESKEKQQPPTTNLENTEQTAFLKVNGNNKEELLTYAFCKVFGELSDVHYEQIEQLSIPFFKSKDERAVKNKPNILIGNQCIVKTGGEKSKSYKIIESGVQRFKQEHSYLESMLKEEINEDFLDALRP